MTLAGNAALINELRQIAQLFNRPRPVPDGTPGNLPRVASPMNPLDRQDEIVLLYKWLASTFKSSSVHLHVSQRRPYPV